MDKIKVLHVVNIANMSYTIKDKMNTLGYDITIIDQPNQYGFYADVFVPVIDWGSEDNSTPFTFILKKISPIINKIWFTFNVIPYIMKNDIIHFNWRTLDPILALDVPILKLLGKKVIVHRRGSEIRGKKEKPLINKYADKILCATPDLLDYTPNAEWLPLPIDTHYIKYVGEPRKDKEIIICHASTHRERKGTEDVIKAVESLQGKYKIKLVLVENMLKPHALVQYQKAHIIIDQLKIGWYANFSQEAMAMGKPTFCYIRKDLYTSNNPIINCNKNSLAEKLEDYIIKKKLRIKTGIKSREYVTKKHGLTNICLRLKEIYKGES